jgi:hypothetical protein
VTCYLLVAAAPLLAALERLARQQSTGHFINLYYQANWLPILSKETCSTTNQCDRLTYNLSWIVREAIALSSSSSLFKLIFSLLDSFLSNFFFGFISANTWFLYIFICLWWYLVSTRFGLLLCLPNFVCNTLPSAAFSILLTFSSIAFCAFSTFCAAPLASFTALAPLYTEPSLPLLLSLVLLQLFVQLSMDLLQQLSQTL